MHHLEHVKGVKPSTLDDDRYLLAAPDALPRKRGRRSAARIMRALDTSSHCTPGIAAQRVIVQINARSRAALGADVSS